MGGKNSSVKFALGNRHRLARAKGDVIEYPAVLAKSDFTFGAPIEIVEDDFRKTALRQTTEVVDIDNSWRGQ